MSDKPDGRGKSPNSQARRFQKGEGGNRKGRPKGATGRRADLYRELERLVSIVENGETQELPMQRILFRAMINKAMKDHRFLELVLREMHRSEREMDFLEVLERRLKARRTFGLDPSFDDLTHADKLELMRKHNLLVNED